MPNQALVYPSIDISDDAWLKTTLLYWDELRTIVPESFSKPYENDTTQELYDSGVLQPLRVNSHMEEIESLTDFVLTYLSSKEGVRLITNNGRRSSRIHAEKLPHIFHEFVGIHPEKMSYQIKKHLNYVFKDGWYRLDEGFSHFYMTLLATKLSERTGASLLTNNAMANDLAISMHLDAPIDQQFDDLVSDDRRMWRRIERSRRREYQAYGDRRIVPGVIGEGLLANLALSKLIISKKTSVKEILSFKSKYSDELGRFHQGISELCKSLDEDIPIEALQEKVATIYANNVNPAINDLKAALSSRNIQWKVEGLIKLTFMSASSFSALAVAGLTTPVALLAGAGVSLTGMAVMHNLEKRREIRSSPFAYLLSAEREFK